MDTPVRENWPPPGLPVYRVGIAVDGMPTYQLDIPTYQGPEAAERRAFWYVAAANPRMNLDRISVIEGETEEVAE